MALILIGFALIVLVDFIPILRRRSGRTAAAFLVFFVPALTLALLQLNGVNVPSTVIVLWKAMKAIGVSY